MKRCILWLAALSLAACGASGALYLPGHQKPRTGPLGKNPHKDNASTTTPAQQPDAPVGAAASNPSSNPVPAAPPP